MAIKKPEDMTNGELQQAYRRLRKSINAGHLRPVDLEIMTKRKNALAEELEKRGISK